MEEANILFQKLAPYAKTPTKGSPLAAGFDLYNCDTVCIQPLSIGTLETKIAICIPEGYCGKIYERSSVALRNHSTCLGGVISSGASEEIKIHLYNLSPHCPLCVKAGSRMAQIVLEKVHSCNSLQLAESLSPSDRNTKGLGVYSDVK